MKIKIYAIFIMILFPIIVIGQYRGTCLTPMADVIFKKGIIYYVINNNADVQLEPLVFPQTYQIAYNTSSTPCKVHFAGKSELLNYLNNVSFEGWEQNDTILFLRATALYKIWSGIGYFTDKAEPDVQLQRLVKCNDMAIAPIAGQVANIENNN